MDRCLGNRCIRCVISIVRWVPVAFVSVIICWAYYTYLVEFCLDMVNGLVIKIGFLLIFHLLLFLFIWSYAQTVISPIGKPAEIFIIPQEIRNELGAANSETEFKSILERYARNQKLPVANRSIDGAMRYCLKCSCIKPDRSHHCSVCGHCVLKFDHHCPWVNTCVNFHNYKYFILFLGYGLLLCLFGFFSILPYFIQFWQSGDMSRTSLGKFAVFFLFFVAGMFGLSLGCLFFYHLYLISKNQTTVESFRPPIFSYGQDKSGYNLGLKRNYQEVFGKAKLKWLLPTFTSLGDGLKYPVNPSIAEIGQQTSSASRNTPAYLGNNAVEMV